MRRSENGDDSSARCEEMNRGDVYVWIHTGDPILGDEDHLPGLYHALYQPRYGMIGCRTARRIARSLHAGRTGPPRSRGVRLLIYCLRLTYSVSQSSDTGIHRNP